MTSLVGDNLEVVISYVPTANTRVRSRGYDQAELIARELSQNKPLPFMRTLLRVGDGRQVGQNRQVRKNQMAQAFTVTNLEQIKDKHILLVDDVLTTGATCEAAAKVLLDAGARRVSAVVFAVA
jgi:ComF family protein